MAFENVFRGIDYMAPVQMEQRRSEQQQGQLMQLLAMKQQKEQQAADRDFRERKLELAANKAPDYKQVALQQIIGQVMKEKGVPYEQAAAEVYNAQSMGAQQFDALGRPAGVSAGLFSNLGIGGQNQAPAPAGGGVSGGPSVPAPVNLAQAENIIAGGRMGPPPAPVGLPQDQSAGVPQVRAQGRYSDSTPAIQEEIKANVGLQEKAASMEIESIFKDRELSKFEAGQQQEYDKNLDELVSGYESLIGAGAEIKTRLAPALTCLPANS